MTGFPPGFAIRAQEACRPSDRHGMSHMGYTVASGTALTLVASLKQRGALAPSAAVLDEEAEPGALWIFTFFNLSAALRVTVTQRGMVIREMDREGVR